MSSTAQPSEITYSDLPVEGSRVRAMTYGSADHEREPRPVRGLLSTVPSPFGSYQCWVNGVQVNPNTVRADEDSSEK